MAGHKKKFVVKIYNKALEDEKKYKVPAAITTAQACLESKYGKKVPKDINTGVYSYNLFGIKATRMDVKKGRYVVCSTHEERNGKLEKEIDYFRAYKSYEGSIKAHTKLLKNRYMPSQSSIKRNGKIEAWCNSLQKKGYATDSSYAKQLKSIIFDTWDLK